MELRVPCGRLYLARRGQLRCRQMTGAGQLARELAEHGLGGLRVVLGSCMQGANTSMPSRPTDAPADALPATVALLR